MSQDTSTSLDLRAGATERDGMRFTAIVTVGLLALMALFFVASGTPPGAVREVLTIAIPALTALAVHSGVPKKPPKDG